MKQLLARGLAENIDARVENVVRVGEAEVGFAALEKPAHATFEIKFYWAFFRVGDARLAEDTVLDHGSRAPQLLHPVELGDSYAGSGYLSRQQPCDPRERQLFKSRSY